MNRMKLPLQWAVLLVLGALVPVIGYAAARADVLVAVAGVNVLLIWASLRVATGGEFRSGSTDDGHDETHETI